MFLFELHTFPALRLYFFHGLKNHLFKRKEHYSSKYRLFRRCPCGRGQLQQGGNRATQTAQRLAPACGPESTAEELQFGTCKHGPASVKSEGGARSWRRGDTGRWLQAELRGGEREVRAAALLTGCVWWFPTGWAVAGQGESLPSSGWVAE